MSTPASSVQPPTPQHLIPSRSPSQQATPGSGGGLRVPTNKKTIYDRNLNRSRNAELSRAAFAYLFSEMVTYAQRRVTGIQDLEKRLNAQGYPLGHRLLDLLLYRSLPISTSSSSSSSGSGSGSSPLPPSTRPTRILPLLTLLTRTLWPLLFSRPASSLEQSTTNALEYMIIDNEPLVNTFISVPKEMNQLNCAAWVAGVVEGVCDASGMHADVSAHNLGTDMWPGRTVFLVKFRDETGARDRELERLGVK